MCLANTDYVIKIRVAYTQQMLVRDLAPRGNPFLQEYDCSAEHFRAELQ